MSGHSRWSTIQRAKGIQDKKRSSLFSKLAKNISVAAREGKDPTMNFKLKMAVEKARQFNMPKSNIEKAVAKGAGEIKGEEILEVIYEGYGPGGVAVIVETATDNKNRTAANVRSLFNKYGGSLGASNSVLWMFERLGVIKIVKSLIKDKDAFILDIIDQGANDVIEEDDYIVIYCPIGNYQKLRDYIEKKEYTVDYSELEFIPKNEVEISQKDKDKFDNFVNVLLDDDDVNNIYTNAKY